MVWQDRPLKLNETPLQKMGDYGTLAGDAFWLGPSHLAMVDQRTSANNKWDYRRLCQYDWFYRDGFATHAHYDRERGLIFVRMHELIMGGPCVHINGKTLDNRRSNLMPSDPKLPPQPETATRVLPVAQEPPPSSVNQPAMTAQELPTGPRIIRPGAVLDILGQPEVRPESFELDI